MDELHPIILTVDDITSSVPDVTEIINKIHEEWIEQQERDFYNAMSKFVSEQTGRFIDSDAFKKIIILGLMRGNTTLGINEKDQQWLEDHNVFGEWKVTDAWPHNIYCSKCFAKFAQEHWPIWDDGSLPRRFCPNCGVPMRGRRQEND